MPSKDKFCHHTIEQIRDCGLLTPERLAEIELLIEARIHRVFLRDGTEVPHAKFVECERPGKGWLHPNTDSDHQQEHLHRTAVAYILTDEERELLNKHCLDAWCRRREAEHFAKAEKISPTEWATGVFLGDSYFSSIAEALDHVTSMDLQEPEYLWPAKSHLVVDEASAASVAGSFIESNGWEDMDTTDLHGLTELQAALEQFMAANASVVSYRADTTKAIVLESAPTHHIAENL